MRDDDDDDYADINYDADMRAPGDDEDDDDDDDDVILKVGGQVEGKLDALELFHLDLPPVTGTVSLSSSSS